MVRIDLKEKETDTGAELEGILAKQRAAFNLAPNPPWAQRKANLQKLGKAIEDHEDEFKKAISDDFGNKTRARLNL